MNVVPQADIAENVTGDLGMKAFVLSGGGNLGATQVGALASLIDRGIEPDMIVGCSVGALNAAFLARGISVKQIEELAAVWRSLTRSDIYPGTRLGALWRFITGKDSLYDNRRFFEYLQRGGVTPAVTFSDYLPLKLYITATHMPAGNLHVFGDNPHDRMLDALMASTALPPMHPPWVVDGERYTDGGTITPLPLRVALDRGAKEIYALHIVSTDAPSGPEAVSGITALATTSINTMLRLQAEHDLLLAEVARRVKLHYIPLTIEETPDALDFDEADRLIESGRFVAETYFASIGLPRRVQTEAKRQRLPWWRRRSGDETGPKAVEAEIGETESTQVEIETRDPESPTPEPIEERADIEAVE